MIDGQRRQSRELVLQVLFQQEFSPKQSIAAGLQTFRASFEAEDGVWDYAVEVLEGIQGHRPAIDQAISRSSAHWTIKRMALVDLNIMRIAVFEIKYAAAPVPTAVAIDEAIEISKKYGSLDSPAFVNGILDQIVKQ